MVNAGSIYRQAGAPVQSPHREANQGDTEHGRIEVEIGIEKKLS